jgi:DNA polymerase-3 subunit gamma/tau
VLGQEHIVKILTNQLRSGTVGHAYLLCGTRGTGKTTMARLLAKGVNCLSDGERPCGSCANCVAVKDGVFMDVIEIDAASNNGVENIRELRESVKYPPSVGRRKVYIVDEVHMLSAGAFNALLKTLEEPPEDVMFVLATTERHKLPATILSRCLRLDFRRVPAETIKNGMRGVCAELGVGVTEEALSLLASNADGSVRDALSLLDQCVCAVSEEVTRDVVLELLGGPGEEQLASLTDMVYAGDVSGALLRLDRLLSEGKDERQLIKDWIEHFRNLMLLKHLEKPEDVLNMSVENIDMLKEQCGRLSPSFINDSIFALAGTLNDARWSARPRVLLEVGIIRIAAPMPSRGTGAPPETKPAPPAPRTAEPKPEPVPEKPAPTPEESVPAAPASPEPSARGALDWQALIDEFKKKDRLLARLDGRSRLAELKEGSFTIEVFDNFTKLTAEDAKTRIEEEVARMTGVPMFMECRLNESAGGQKTARSAGAPRKAATEPEPAGEPPSEPPWGGEEARIQEAFDFGSGRERQDDA